jgi:non-ribosomal peptide synthetase component E (peptide arylation enzyme)
MASFDPAYFRAQGWWRDETLRDWLERHRAGDRAAVRTFDDTLTYAGFAARVETFAAALADAGIGLGDVVAVHLPNIPEFLIAWLAINELGAIMQTARALRHSRDRASARASGAKACLALAQLRIARPRSRSRHCAGACLPCISPSRLARGCGARELLRRRSYVTKKCSAADGDPRQRSIEVVRLLRKVVVAEGRPGHLQSFPEQCAYVRGRARHHRR